MKAITALFLMALVGGLTIAGSQYMGDKIANSLNTSAERLENPQ